MKRIEKVKGRCRRRSVPSLVRLVEACQDQVLESIGAMAMVVNEEMVVLEANGAARARLGAVVGRRSGEVLRSAEAEGAVRECLAGGEVTRRAGGGVVVTTRLLDGESGRVVLIVEGA